MSETKQLYLDLEEYIRQGEPEKIERCEAWQTAIGLQQVDGLKPSIYLVDTAKEHIEGNITIVEAQNRIESYYEERKERVEAELETKEADIVSVRIAKLLGERTFQFSPVEWFNIHRQLFTGVFEHAGQIRTYNITKKEWILKGDTVLYASWNSIKDTLDYDFKMEKQFSYKGLSMNESIKHLAKFTSDIWQIHPFCEGNTRATAIFMIKYMKTFGLKVNNDLFQKHSWYFRNALVRANYSNWDKNIYATTKYLEMFYGNLLLGMNYELKNRHMHLEYTEDTNDTNCDTNDTNRDTFFNSFEDHLLELIIKIPNITQKELSEQLNVSIITIKRTLSKLQKEEIVKREGSNRKGKWIVIRGVKNDTNGQ